LFKTSELASKLSPTQKRFFAEVIGTFIVVLLATGSVVLDARSGGMLGLPFIAFAPFVGVALGVYLFANISMAHFNPAVSLGFLITGHITKKQFFQYLAAETVGALLASLFVLTAIGTTLFRCRLSLESKSWLPDCLWPSF
jgi:aquaporin Z